MVPEYASNPAFPSEKRPRDDVNDFGCVADNVGFVHSKKLFGFVLLHLHNLSAQRPALGVAGGALVMGEETVGDVGEEKEDEGDLP